MARRSREDRDLDSALAPELRGAAARDDDGPTRTQRKHASAELQALGEQLIALRVDSIAGLPLPDRVKDAVVEAKRITSFGARRRQAQYIGKLMRGLDAHALEAARAAVRSAHAPSARQTALLHRAERVRDALLESDTELERWLAEFPDTDAQRLRALLRQARRDARTTRDGEAMRGRAYREIFAIVRAALLGRV